MNADAEMLDTPASMKGASRRSRHIFSMAATLAGLWVAQAVVRQPATAARTTDGVGRVALEHAAAGRFDTARALATTVLADAPLAAGAVQAMGSVTGAQRQFEDAGRWMSVAGLLGWRHTPTQIWLIDAALRGGDFTTVVERADGLLRRQELMPEVNAVLWGLAATPGGAAPLTTRLVAEPEWRRSFLGDVTGLEPELRDAHDALLTALASTEAPPSRAELAFYTQALVKDNDYARAFRLWRTLTPAGRKAGAVPYDGAFSSAPDRPLTEQMPFEWTIRTVAGASSAIEPGGASGAHLAVRTDGSALATIAQQLIQLPPGRYRFSAELEAPMAGAAQAFDWMLRCLPSNRAIDEDRPALAAGVIGKPAVRFAFTVPADCTVQKLQLNTVRLSPPAPTEAAFDNVRIVPAG